MGRLNNKVALITGGCSGIGEGIALRFIGEGASVVVVDRDGPRGKLAETAADKLQFVAADVTDSDALHGAFEQTCERFGGLDILVNNAGSAGHATPIVDQNVADWDAMFNLLVKAQMLGIKFAAPMMQARGGGSIVNISSIAGLRTGLTAGAAYSVAKAAALKLTTSAALELAPDNIRVNAILPGAIATPMLAAGLALSPELVRARIAEVEAVYAKSQPMPIAGTPGHIAGAVLFFASDDSAFVTGTELIVDGGLTLDPARWKATFDKRTEMAARFRAEA